jgi:CheY-like chemotaxis protein
MMVLPKSTQLLLVEDDKGHAALIQLNLREAGLSNPINHFEDGQAVLNYIRQQAYDSGPPLLLLDLNLPGIDGYEVLKELKGDPKTQKIPVIILTSTDDPKEIERCYELGCNFFLTKPINYMDFVHVVKQMGSFLAVVEVPGSRH